MLFSRRDSFKNRIAVSVVHDTTVWYVFLYSDFVLVSVYMQPGLAVIAVELYTTTRTTVVDYAFLLRLLSGCSFVYRNSVPITNADCM